MTISYYIYPLTNILLVAKHCAAFYMFEKTSFLLCFKLLKRFNLKLQKEECNNIFSLQLHIRVLCFSSCYLKSYFFVILSE